MVIPKDLSGLALPWKHISWCALPTSVYSGFSCYRHSFGTKIFVRQEFERLVIFPWKYLLSLMNEAILSGRALYAGFETHKQLRNKNWFYRSHHQSIVSTKVQPPKFVQVSVGASRDLIIECKTEGLRLSKVRKNPILTLQINFHD